MNVENKIKDRLSDAVAKSYYKPWYRRMWGKIALVVGAVILVILLYFLFRVAVGYYHAQKGQIYNEELGIWLTEEAYIENQKKIADLMTDDDPWLGADNPIINVIVFESFACPFCHEDQSNLKQMMEKFGPLVRLTVKDFPTEAIHPGVFEAHLAAACAQEQDAYWPYHDLLFENQSELDKKNLKLHAANLGLSVSQFNNCLDDEKYRHEIRQDYADGVEQGVVGTPSYIVNGQLIEGTISYDMWEEIIGFILKGEQ